MSLSNITVPNIYKIYAREIQVSDSLDFSDTNMNFTNSFVDFTGSTVIGLPSGSTPTLAQVLTAGNVANQDINMSTNKIINVTEIDNSVGNILTNSQVIQFNANNLLGIILNNNRSIKFGAYGLGNFTGLVTYILAVDNAGNIIETTSTAPNVNGSAYGAVASNILNVTSAGVDRAYYQQINDIVHVSLNGTIDSTVGTGSLCVFQFTLPIVPVPTFTAGRQSGTGFVLYSAVPFQIYVLAQTGAIVLQANFISQGVQSGITWGLEATYSTNPI